MGARTYRWSDEDRYFGPFTYAPQSASYRPIAMLIGSGDNEQYSGCKMRVSGFGHTLIVDLPRIIKPWRRWVDTSKYAWSTSKDSGFWDYGAREYGFSCNDGFLNVSLGRVTKDSSTEQRRGYFLPWKSWRHVRRSFYGLAGEHVSTLPEGVRSFDKEREIAAACPTRAFDFKDYDGEWLRVTTRIEEREWRLGEGRFKWLSWFGKPMIRRSLDLNFSGETGKRKGSWKGGTIGSSIDMLPGELHEAAFRRYCAENKMTFMFAA